MSCVRTALILCLGGLCACDGTPGEARIELYEAASAESRWRKTLPSQEFSVDELRADGTLRIDTSDFCWDANYSMEFEHATGALRSQVRRQPRSGTGGAPPVPVTTSCESGFVAQRITLSNDLPLQLCGYTDDGVLSVLNPLDGSERLRLSPSGTPVPRVAGDYLLLDTVDPPGLEAHSLLTGEELWRWTAPEPYTLEAADAERVYLLSEAGTAAYAFALADGAAVWQKNLGCDSLSLAGDALVCHQTQRGSTCDSD